MVSRRGFLQGISALSVSDLIRPGIEAEAISPKAPSELAQQQPTGTPSGHRELECGNSLVRVRISGSSSDFWSLENRASSQIYRFGCPVFPLGGKTVAATLKEVRGRRCGREVEEWRNRMLLRRTPYGKTVVVSANDISYSAGQPSRPIPIFAREPGRGSRWRSSRQTAPSPISALRWQT